MDSQEFSFLTSIFPILFVFLSLALVVTRIAARKGKNQVLYVLAMVVPLVNVLTLLWLVSLTDAAVLEELAKLRTRLAQMNPA